MRQVVKVGALLIVGSSMWVNCGVRASNPGGTTTNYSTQSNQSSGNATPGSTTNKPTLGFTETINLKKLGFAADPNVDGKTLKDIITSAKSGRADSKLCSECHNKSESPGNYSVNVDPNQPSPNLKVTDKLGTPPQSWVGTGANWTDGFIGNDTKPQSLKDALSAWKNGGWKD